VTVAARDPDRAKTLRRLNDRGAAIDHILTGFAGAIEKVETTAVRVSPQLKSNRAHERVSGYLGVVHSTITMAAFERIGELIAALADQDLTDVTGPWWALRPDSPVHRRARVEAAHEAVRRARDYAQALGSELSGLVELADVRLLSDARGHGDHAFAASATLPARQSGAPDELTFDIEPAKQIVRATVEARLVITGPDLANVARTAPQ